MSVQPTYFASKWTIAAQGVVTINRTAEAITCLASTAPFRIRLDNGTETSFEQGLTFKSDVTFNRVELVNNGTTAVEVEIAFARGDVRDSRLVIAGAVQTRDKTVIRPINFSPGSFVNQGQGVEQIRNDVTVPAQTLWTQIADTLSLRRRLICRIVSGEAEFYCGAPGLPGIPTSSGAPGAHASMPGSEPFLIADSGDVVEVPGGGFTYARGIGGDAVISAHEEIYV